MTHGFDADGRLFMEIHDSDYLELCAANRRTFAPGAVAAEYARMRAAEDGREAAAFRDKLGRLEPSCRDEDAQRRLREALGTPLHRRLLEALRDENSHMLAGGVVHEGIHAGVGRAEAGLLQAEFLRGGTPVQWDELLAFMAESGYHARFCRWAAREISGSRGDIEAALRRLERLRRRPLLRPGPDRLAFERAAAAAGAFVALARLRMRESWQSALRLQALASRFRGDYVRGEPPPDVAEDLAALDREASASVEAFGRAARTMELGLRSVEETLGFWAEWADGRRPFPPPNTDSLAAVRKLAAVTWPDPPVERVRALMRRAEASLMISRRSR